MALRARRLLALAFIAIWLVTLALPAVTMGYGGAPKPTAGWQMLVFGWVGTAYLQFAWYANPILAAVVVGLVRKTTSRRWFRITGLSLLATTASTIQLFIWPEFNHLFGVHAGLFIWVAINVIAGITALLLARDEHVPNRRFAERLPGVKRRS